MAENAEDIQEGRSCSLCGQYFADDSGIGYTHGYPVVCRECWSELSKRERKQYQQAKAEVV